MPYVDSYSFSHRFTDDKACTDYAGYQEIIHHCSEVNATALARQFYQFALACGYAPQNIVDAFFALADEYGKAHCGKDYNGEKLDEQC